MSRLPPIDLQTLPEPVRAKLAMVEAAMGFIPNSLGALGHRPDILDAFLSLGVLVMGRPGDKLHQIKALCAYVTSNAAGCRYCQAHTASTAARSGIDPAKISAAFAFETSTLFSPAERAALNVAARAGMVPNQVEDADIDQLRAHFTDAECAEIMAMIGLFGFLNRWNDSLATSLEPEPLQVAPELLATSGWEPGKHGGKR